MYRHGVSQKKYSLNCEKKKFFGKISITFLMLILCALVAPSVSAEGYNVLNTDSPVLELESELYSSPSGVLNVINTSSDNLSNIMNSLPSEDLNGSVINPASAISP